MSADADPPLLQMRDIHVSYGQTPALRGVDFDLRAGEIHALVGEHGAGKSSLVNLLCGTVHMSRGEVRVRGVPLESLTPREAASHGIAMIAQNLSVISSFNAVENVFAGRVRGSFLGSRRRSSMRSEAARLCERLHLRLNLDAPLERLSRSEQQMVELMRIVSIDPCVAIFDEVSSRFTPEDMEVIYRILFDFKSSRTGVIYISHDMDEIFRFADRVTILRRGMRTATEEIKDLDQSKLILLTNSFVMSRQELERDNLQLYALKKYNDAIIQNIPVGIVILDPEGSVYLTNLFALEILGLNAEGIRRSPMDDILGRDAPRLVEEIRAAVAGREKRTWEEVPYADGKYLRLSLFPFRQDGEAFIGTIILIQDITRDKSFKEYWLRTERIASTAQMAAGVAHEINNPLGIVNNYIQLLKVRPQDAYSSEKLAKMEKEVVRIKRIVGSLLSFSQVREQAWERIDTVRITEEVVELLHHQLNARGITVRRAFSAEEQHILGDEDTIKQLVMNLILNSIEAIGERGMIEIKVWNDPGTNVGYLAVRDDGCGIPEQIIQKIFDPFFTTKLTSKNAGLGLTVCHDIVENHGGIITCTSVPGERTEFTIRFPLCVTTGTRAVPCG